MRSSIPSFLLAVEARGAVEAEGKSGSVSFVERGIAAFARLMHDTFIQWELASRKGLLQSLDARINVLFWITMVVIVSFKKTIVSLVCIGLLVFVLAVIARISLRNVYGRVLPLTFFFGFLVSAPAMLNIITPGSLVVAFFSLSAPMTFWNIAVPQQIGITEEGVLVCLRLMLRVFASLSISFLMLSVTPFSEIVRALKMFRVPDSLLLVLTLTYKYIYLFARMILDMYRAKNARLVLGISAADYRAWSAGRMATLFRKSQVRADDIYRAMLCRGFSGEIRLAGRQPSINVRSAGAFLLVFFVLVSALV
ncbi:MAG: cobalt/nickel transport system permease protein [Nitrospirae bacterium]|nr:MAG: cobalt/nickel transport system permease protein [Nitrospirota bacterium]